MDSKILDLRGDSTTTTLLNDIIPNWILNICSYPHRLMSSSLLIKEISLCHIQRPLKKKQPIKTELNSSVIVDISTKQLPHLRTGGTVEEGTREGGRRKAVRSIRKFDVSLCLLVMS